MKDMHREVKVITDQVNNKIRGNIRDKNDNILFEQDCILKRWNEYIGELFEDNRKESPPEIIGNEEPPITLEEVEHALHQTKGGKAPGEDQITSEIVESPR